MATALDFDAPAPAHAGGLSRRRVLVGAAWLAPTIVAASAAPAFAASEAPSPQGTLVNNVRGHDRKSYSVDGVGSVRAQTLSTYLQYKPLQENPPAASLVDVWVTIEVNNVTSPLMWGINNAVGIPSTYAWQVRGTPQLVNGVFTATLGFVGGTVTYPIPPWSGGNLDNLWVRVSSAATRVRLNAYAIDANGATLVTPGVIA
ncbi:hypothetical protein ON058_09565 [Demequina sp. B12]|uniref:hypothetical protein n=1 Tax=Demequina sp. B12 TaxID=2992757 RepID=UPI00237C4FF7|nr:hypothetical protein [Demequina sp. B12]MDE0573660.1 hypothetical protein [Demequina sp. B12]